MNRLELNRSAFFLKIAVQLAVLIYLMIEVGVSSLLLWLVVVSSVVYVSTLAQMKLPDGATRSRYWWIFFEWIIIVTLFPFVQYSPYFFLMIVLIVTALQTIENLHYRTLFTLIFAITPVIHSIYTDAFTLRQLISFLLLLMFFISYSYFYRKFEEQQWKLEELNESLRGIC